MWLVVDAGRGVLAGVGVVVREFLRVRADFVGLWGGLVLGLGLGGGRHGGDEYYVQMREDEESTGGV